MNELHALLPDGGMAYTETNLGRFIVEPFNAISAFVFFVIALYWIRKLKGAYVQYSFLSTSAFILSIGAIGGTIYHAFRISRIFMLMDWLPILILCLMAGFYFMRYATLRWWKTILGSVFLVGIHILLWQFMKGLDERVAMNLNYVMMGAYVLFPVIYFSAKYQFRNFSYVMLALLTFSVALLFRIYDHEAWLPVGTHFLWHCFGALACHFMFIYIYKSSPARNISLAKLAR